MAAAGKRSRSSRRNGCGNRQCNMRQIEITGINGGWVDFAWVNEPSSPTARKEGEANSFWLFQSYNSSLCSQAGMMAMDWANNHLTCCSDLSCQPTRN